MGAASSACFPFAAADWAFFFALVFLSPFACFWSGSDSPEPPAAAASEGTAPPEWMASSVGGNSSSSSSSNAGLSPSSSAATSSTGRQGSSSSSSMAFPLPFFPFFGAVAAASDWMSAGSSVSRTCCECLRVSFPAHCPRP